MLHAGEMLAEAVTPPSAASLLAAVGIAPPDERQRLAELASAALLLVAIGLALGDPLQRWLLGLVVVPLGLIWAAAFSYDLRNLAMILPFAGAAAGTGLLRAAEWLGHLARSRQPVGCVKRTAGELVGSAPSQALNSGPDCSDAVRATHQASGTPVLHPPAAEKCRQDESGSPAAAGRAGGPLARLRVGRVAGFLLLAVVAACLCVSDKTLRECQQRQQRLVGISDLNQQLYAYFPSRGGPGRIATDYQALPWLPELGPRSVPCTCETSNAFRAAYDRPEVRYALVRYKGAATAVQHYLDGPAARLVFEAGDYRLYEKPAAPRTRSRSERIIPRDSSPVGRIANPSYCPATIFRAGVIACSSLR